MRLSKLIPGTDPRRDPTITGLTADSRQVRPGYLFAALPGHQADGRNFIPDAVARGAVAVLTAPRPQLAARCGDALLIEDRNPRRRLAQMAAAFHGAQPAVMVAVTGTNGKTSVVEGCRQIWRRLGMNAASMGTLGTVRADGDGGGSLTTPDPVTLHDTLATLAADGYDHLAIEASSHGLDQYRLDGIALVAAAFTNLSQDHLDYHGDMDGYMRAKTRLFTEILPREGTAVLNRDSRHFQSLVDLAVERGQKIVSFGRQAAADLCLEAAIPGRSGQEIAVRTACGHYHIHLPLIGGFQAHNALAAAALTIAAGADEAAVIDSLTALVGAPGRLQLVARSAQGAAILVDYAHTPDALATMLNAIRPHVAGRLAVVFGCGGDRDPGKRPMMGAAATDHADLVWLTDDNPRGEDPATIRAAARAGCPQATEIGDRAEAIAAAIAALGPDDLLVVAGKGHEPGQIVGDRVLPFDDSKVARAAAIAGGGCAVGVAA